MSFYNNKQNRKLLFDICPLENEGIGMWYEYLAKLRIYPKDLKKILVFGLPQIYGVGADSLVFCNPHSKLKIVDERQNKINTYSNILNKLLSDCEVEFVKTNTLIDYGIENNKYDLVINSEVLQQYSDYEKVIQKMIDASDKHILFFISNADCYAHPKYSGLKSIKLKNAYDKIKKMSVKIKDYGYCDIPPWPSGINVSNKSEKSSPAMELIKKITILLSPFLARLEKYYPMFIKKKAAHFIYFHLIKK